MGVILSAIALAIVLAVIAGYSYYAVQEPVYRAQPMDSVRVGDPGHNLVGSNWTGNPSAERDALGHAATGDQATKAPH